MKNRADRVAIVSWHDIHCESLDPSFVLSASDCLSNLSMSGLAFKKEKVLKTPDIGSQVKVRLAIKGQSLELQLKVVRINDIVVGVTFEKPSLSVLGILKNYFLVEVAAMRMSPVASHVLKASDKGHPHWFEGEKQASLYYIEQNREIREFQLSFLEHVVEYTENNELKFGKRVIDFKSKAFETSRSPEWEKFWTRDTVEIARRFVDSIPKLGEAERSFLNKILTKIPTSN